jgi:hypothetical protein
LIRNFMSPAKTTSSSRLVTFMPEHKQLLARSY